MDAKSHIWGVTGVTKVAKSYLWEGILVKNPLLYPFSYL